MNNNKFYKDLSYGAVKHNARVITCEDDIRTTLQLHEAKKRNRVTNVFFGGFYLFKEAFQEIDCAHQTFDGFYVILALWSYRTTR